jgi:hypothetical protein
VGTITESTAELSAAAADVTASFSASAAAAATAAAAGEKAEEVDDMSLITSPAVRTSLTTAALSAYKKAFNAASRAAATGAFQDEDVLSFTVAACPDSSSPLRTQSLRAAEQGAAAAAATQGPSPSELYYAAYSKAMEVVISNPSDTGAGADTAAGVDAVATSAAAAAAWRARWGAAASAGAGRLIPSAAPASLRTRERVGGMLARRRAVAVAAAGQLHPPPPPTERDYLQASTSTAASNHPPSDYLNTTISTYTSSSYTYTSKHPPPAPDHLQALTAKYLPPDYLHSHAADRPASERYPTSASAKIAMSAIGATRSTYGRALQVDPMKPILKPPGTEHLKLECDIPPSTFGFKFNLCRYSMASASTPGPRVSPLGSALGLIPGSGRLRLKASGQASRVGRRCCR